MPINSRSKGKRIENHFANLLRPIFPNIHRNWKEQTAIGGVDFSECDPFDFEVKGGTSVKIKKIRNIITQLQNEGTSTNWKVALIKPDHEEEYAIIPMDDFIEMLASMKQEEIF